MESDNLPLGATHDPNAPYNQEQFEGIDESLMVPFEIRPCSGEYDENRVFFIYQEFDEHIYCLVTNWPFHVENYPFWQNDIEEEIKKWCYDNLSETLKVIVNINNTEY